MTEYPAWDYWLYQDLGDGTYRSIHDADLHLDEGDLRCERYDADVEKWSRESFWNAREAALLSFFRDPDKFQDTEDDVIFGLIYDGDESSSDEHAELRKHITLVHDLIEDAQQAGLLNHDFFLPLKYVDWAERVGIDFPGNLKDKLVANETKRENDLATYRARRSHGIINGFEAQSDAVSSDEVDAPYSIAESSNLEDGPQAERNRNNYKLVLYAFILKHGVMRPKDIFYRLQHEFKDQKRYVAGVKIPSQTTIGNILEAVDLRVAEFHEKASADVQTADSKKPS